MIQVRHPLLLQAKLQKRPSTLKPLQRIQQGDQVSASSSPTATRFKLGMQSDIVNDDSRGVLWFFFEMGVRVDVQNKQTQGNLKDAQGEAWDTAGRLRDTVASAVGYDAKQGESAGKS